MQSTTGSVSSAKSIHTNRVRNEMMGVGVTKIGFTRLDARHLPRVIHDTEHVMGLTYGRDEAGPIMLVCTDERIICLRKAPYLVDLDDVNYSVVSSVSLSHTGFGATVVLYTRTKNFKVHTFNHKAAQRFVDYVNSHI